MVVLGLLLVFLVIPVALVLLSVLLPVMGRFWLLFLVFPLALILFAVVRHLRTPLVDDGGERRPS